MHGGIGMGVHLKNKTHTKRRKERGEKKDEERDEKELQWEEIIM